MELTNGCHDDRLTRNPSTDANAESKSCSAVGRRDLFRVVKCCCFISFVGQTLVAVKSLQWEILHFSQYDKLDCNRPLE